MPAVFFRVSPPVYRGLAALAQHKAVLVPLGPKLLREPDDAYDYTLLSQMLLPVTSVMLDDYASAKIQFPAAFAAMKRLAEIGIDTSEERELLFHHYARYLWQTGNPQEAKKYEEQARALKLRQEVEELKPWWKKSS